MKHWVVADTHFGHDMLVNRGYRPADFAERLLKNIDEMVGPDDVLLHLGDVNIYKNEFWHQRLRDAVPTGKLWLVRGNHDRQTDSWYIDHGWDWVGDSMTLRKFGRDINITHRPIDLSTYADNYVNIHGHLHTMDRPDRTYSWYNSERNILVSMEQLQYKPVMLRKLVGE